MIFYFFGGLYLFLQLFLIFDTNFFLHPEMYFLPWLVSKGLLPYRDFFDHHGFLIYYLLSPFATDITFSSLKYFYIFIQSFNFILVLLILKKITNKLGFILGGYLYVLISFYINENFFWFEVFIVTIYLLIFYILNYSKLGIKSYILGVLVALASMIKPQAVVILFLLLILKKDSKILLGFLAPWVFTITFFYINGTVTQMIDNLFLFNLFLSEIYSVVFRLETKFYLATLFLLFVGLLIGLKENSNRKKMLFLFGFMAFSLVFLASGYSRWHYDAFFYFFCDFCLSYH